MFNLETAIAEWRRQMQADGIKSPVPLEELENHLREDVERKICGGLDAERAFQRAVQRMGRGDGLRQEFEKVEGAKRKRRRELLRRWSVIGAIGFIYLVVGSTWWLGVSQGKFEITWVEILLGAGVVVPIILCGWAGRSIAKRLPLINENWVVAMAFVALFLGAFLFRMFFPIVSPVNLVHLQIAVLWGLSPTLGFGECVSVWHERCEEFRKSNHKQTA